jgi:hypothetical protein
MHATPDMEARNESDSLAAGYRLVCHHDHPAGAGAGALLTVFEG